MKKAAEYQRPQLLTGVFATAVPHHAADAWGAVSLWGRWYNDPARPLTRKDAPFAGSTDGAKTWARIASLIGSCNLNGMNPFDGLARRHWRHGPVSPCIAATLRKILDNHMQRDIAELMPWNFGE